MIHRDVKPANLFLCDTGQVKVTDARATASSPAATGPAMVQVPNVVGMTFAKARLVLLGDGFRVAGEHARLGQVVTSTSPSGQAPAGSVIIVVYGTGL